MYQRTRPRLRRCGLMRILSLTAVVSMAATLGAPTALASPADSDSFSESAAPGFVTVAAGLDNPRGLSVAGNGDIYVAEAGHGGSGACMPDPDNPEIDTCFGTSGAISRIRNGAVTPVVTGLPSLAPQVATQNGQVPPGAQATGPSDVAITGTDSVAFTIGLGANPTVRDNQLVPTSSVAQLLGTLATTTIPGTAATTTVLADIAAFEGEHDPVPGAAGPDSNANGLIADSSGYTVVDAGGNDVLRVSSTGKITLTAPLPASTTTCPPSPAQPEAVPTSVVRGPDGALYVGELTGFPFCEGGASIYRITDRGTVTKYAAGLTNVTGLAFGHDGTLYAVELAQHGLLQGPIGAVVAIPQGGGNTMADYHVVADGLLAPYGIAINGNRAYVTVGSILPATAGGGGIISVSLPAAGGNSSANCASKPFPDVARTNTHCRNITWLKDQGLTLPADGKYHASQPVTRGQLALFLYRLVNPGTPAPHCSDKPFNDVPRSNVFCGAIAWAASNGITFGVGNGQNFAPQRAVTRGQMSAFLKRIATTDSTATCAGSPFTDVGRSSTFCGTIAWLAQTGLTSGTGNGSTYSPSSVVTRGQMASFLHRVADYRLLHVGSAPHF